MSIFTRCLHPLFSPGSCFPPFHVVAFLFLHSPASNLGRSSQDGIGKQKHFRGYTRTMARLGRRGWTRELQAVLALKGEAVTSQCHASGKTPPLGPNCRHPQMLLSERTYTTCLWIQISVRVVHDDAASQKKERGGMRTKSYVLALVFSRYFLVIAPWVQFGLSESPRWAYLFFFFSSVSPARSSSIDPMSRQRGSGVTWQTTGSLGACD